MPPPEWLIPGPFPPEFPASERCIIAEHLNLPESPEASLALVRVAPGILLRGTGLVEVAGETAAVAPGDRVLIPPGAPQRITNTGAGDLEFYELCTPRFRPEAYVDLET